MASKITNSLVSIRACLSGRDSFTRLVSAWASVILIIASLTIAIWQVGLGSSPLFNKIYYKYGIHHSCGASFSDPEHMFAYGLYYWGEFPVFPDREELPAEYDEDSYFYSKKGAMGIWDNYGSALRMDIGGTFRMGNGLNLWVPYLVALSKGTVKGSSYIPFNGMFFIVSLMMLLAMMWFYGRGLLGVILVALLGSYPFQIYSVYFQDNIFSFMISSVILMIAVCVPFIFDVEMRWRRQVLLAAVCGVLAGIGHQLRADCLAALLVALGAMILYSRSGIMKKAVTCLILLLFYTGTEHAVQGYLNSRFDNAVTVVKAKGGKVFEGYRLKNHLFWHTIWCGMCDFDETYKHSWSDFVAEFNAKKVLKAKYGKNIGKLQYHHEPVDYYMPGWEPDYDNAMKDLVFADVKNDPAWYFGILGKRLQRTFYGTVPPAVTFTDRLKMALPYNPLAYFFAIVLVACAGGWPLARIVLLSMASMIIPIFVTTFSNYFYYSIVHIMAAGVIIYAVIKIAVCYSGPIFRKGLLWKK